MCPRFIFPSTIFRKGDCRSLEGFEGLFHAAPWPVGGRWSLGRILTVCLWKAGRETSCQTWWVVFLVLKWSRLLRRICQRKNTKTSNCSGKMQIVWTSVAWNGKMLEHNDFVIIYFMCVLRFLYISWVFTGGNLSDTCKIYGKLTTCIKYTQHIFLRFPLLYVVKPISSSFFVCRGCKMVEISWDGVVMGLVCIKLRYFKSDPLVGGISLLSSPPHQQ